MEEAQHQHLIEFAESAIRIAQDIRQFHRKRSKVGSAQRKTDIAHAQTQLKTAMAPIRSALGRIPYLPINETTRRRRVELLAISDRLQRERRRLWKLNNGGDRKRGPRGGRTKR